MGKSVAFFSTGLPDPTQGGSGIFNYLMCREMLTRKLNLRAFFRVNEHFVRNHNNPAYLEELKRQGLQYQFVYERRYHLDFMFGDRLLLSAHQYPVCREVVADFVKEASDVQACISLDLGWALALSQVTKRKICILGDPMRSRLLFGQRSILRGLSFWRSWLQAQSLRNADMMLKPIAESAILGCFSPHHARDLRDQGINCRHFRFYTPEVRPRKSRRLPTQAPSKLVALHVGTLETTASRNMVQYWLKELLPALARLPIAIEIRFIGRVSKPVESRWDNIKLSFAGHLDDLESEFYGADFFLSPMKYPVGIRTRIITALSYGLPVIADKTALIGLAELSDGKDILCGSTAQEVASIVKKLIDAPAMLDQIGLNARKSWERYYQPSTNISEMLQLLDLD